MPQAKGRTLEAVIQYARGESLHAMKVIAGVMHDPEASPGARLKASELILERGVGRVAHKIETKGEMTIQHQHLIALKEATDIGLARIEQGDAAKHKFVENIEADDIEVDVIEPGTRKALTR